MFNGNSLEDSFDLLTNRICPLRGAFGDSAIDKSPFWLLEFILTRLLLWLLLLFKLLLFITDFCMCDCVTWPVGGDDFKISNGDNVDDYEN